MTNQRLVEMAEYMEACALIARNGADIHNGSKELREHADMISAIANYLSSAAEPTATTRTVGNDVLATCFPEGGPSFDLKHDGTEACTNCGQPLPRSTE